MDGILRKNGVNHVFWVNKHRIFEKGFRHKGGTFGCWRYEVSG
jgi:hypothetical protein